MFDQNPNQPNQPNQPMPPQAPKFGPNPFSQPQPVSQQQPPAAPRPMSQATGPANLPVDDMFSTTEAAVPRTGAAAAARQAFGAPVSPVTQPAPAFQQPYQQPVPQPAPYSPSVEELFGGRGLPWGKIISVIVILAVVGGAGFAAYWGYNYFSAAKKSAAPIVQQPAVEISQPQTPVVTPAVTTTATTTIIITETTGPAALDSDSDGLTDDEEKKLGTDPFRADTDNDGLTDWAEIKIYRTDPLNPDTDGDGYKDGNEVIKGYDPLKPGSARLYEAPKQ